MNDTTSPPSASASVTPSRSSDAIRHPFAEVAARLSDAAPFDVVFETPEVSIELYAPAGMVRNRERFLDDGSVDKLNTIATSVAALCNAS